MFTVSGNPVSFIYIKMANTLENLVTLKQKYMHITTVNNIH